MSMQPGGNRMSTFPPTSRLTRATVRKTSILLAVVLLVVGLLGTSQPAHADIITVNNPTDENIPSDGSCSLVEAIANANSSSDTTGGDCAAGTGTDTITFDSTVFSTPQTIMIAGTYTITATITISGAGRVALDGNNNKLILSVANSGSLTLDHVTVQNGYGGSGPVGGIDNNGTLVVSNSIFSHHQGNQVGSIRANAGSQTTITNSTFNNNFLSYFLNNGTATISGSTFTGSQSYGILNEGVMTVTGTTISSNGSAGGGGGITNGEAATATLTINASTISNNLSSAGAGINNAASGTLTVTNSTISGNVAPSLGGAISNSGTVTVTGSTFAFNNAMNGGDSIYTTSSGSSTYLAGNIFQNASSGNCFGPQTDNGYNVSNDGSCSFTNLTSNNNAFLNFSALVANDGGTALTRAPAWRNDGMGIIPNGTTITNNGTTLACNGSTSDENGISHPRVTGANCTSGAVEASQALYTCPDPNNIATFADLSSCLLHEYYLPSSPTLTLGANISMSMELPSIVNPVTIHGAGHTLAPTASIRVLWVRPSGNLTLDNITIQNGYASSGGAILNNGTLTVTNSTLSGNNAPVSAYGGAIFNTGTLSATNTTFSNNFATSGGALYNDTGAQATITSSTFSAGSSTNNDLYNKGTAMVDTTSFTGNLRYAINNFGTLTLNGSTVTNNGGTVYPSSGGITNNGTLAVTNTTISANSTFVGNSGGGITNGGTLTVTNSVISGNTAVGNAAATITN